VRPDAAKPQALDVYKHEPAAWNRGAARGGLRHDLALVPDLAVADGQREHLEARLLERGTPVREALPGRVRQGSLLGRVRAARDVQLDGGAALELRPRRLRLGDHPAE